MVRTQNLRAHQTHPWTTKHTLFRNVKQLDVQLLSNRNQLYIRLGGSFELGSAAKVSVSGTQEHAERTFREVIRELRDMEPWYGPLFVFNSGILPFILGFFALLLIVLGAENIMTKENGSAL